MDQEMRALRRKKLYELLGKLPEQSRKVSAYRIAEEKRDSYVLESLILDLNGIEHVPAYFLRETTVEGLAPTILYNHTHVQGKDEVLTGNEFLLSRGYGEELTKRGFSVLAIDAWGFGERAGRTESEIFKDMLWHGKVLWGMMVFDSLKALDYLESRADVDDSRIGTFGFSMGSNMAFWVAALDMRIKVCVEMCCLTDFEELINIGNLDGHGIYYYVPNLLNHFTCAEINDLIVPRYHLGIAGVYDRLTPRKGLDRIERYLSSAYAKAGVSEAWTLLRFPVGHKENTEMRVAALNYLQEHL